MVSEGVNMPGADGFGGGQISTALDRAYINSGDRRHMFWSITLTFLLSVSFSLFLGGGRLGY